MAGKTGEREHRCGIIARMRRAVPQYTRIYAPDALAPGAQLALSGPAAHHLSRVLRATVGDHVVVFNAGVEFGAVITRIDKHGVSVKLEQGAEINRENPLPCLLAQAISSGERMDLTLQKAVELGVHRVQPLYSERSIVRLDPDRLVKRVEHWRQIMIAACEQSGRNVVPAVASPQPVIEWLGGLPPPGAGELRIMLSPHAEQRLAELTRPARVVLMAGPEGGFTEVEAAFARQRGFVELRLGPRVLRTETAALAALSAINTLWGDF